MRVYEEYQSATEKRRAQAGAKLGKPTGVARGYIFVYDENGVNGRGNYDAVASVFNVEAGDDDPRGRLASTGVSVQYLRECCRKIGGCHLPPKWRKSWDYYR